MLYCGHFRTTAHRCLVTVLILGLLDMPALGGVSSASAPAVPTARPSDKALGVVIQSQVGRLGKTDLTTGTSVYAGDALWTDVGGTLRMKIGSAQVYLLASSAVTLGQEDGAVQATLSRGTAGFSATPTDRIQLIVPQGIVRSADGQAGYGQVTILGPKEVMIAAYRGALVLDNAGELQMIAAGTAYKVTLLDDDGSQEPAGAGTPPMAYHDKRRRKKLLCALILMGGAAVGSYILYEKLTTSPSSFSN